MSKVRGYLLLTLIFLLLTAGCTLRVAIPSPTPLPTATMTPTHTPTPVPSPTPTVHVAALMQEVRDLLGEAATLEAEQDLEAAQESALQALALYLSLPEIQEISEEEIEDELFSLGKEAAVWMWFPAAPLPRVKRVEGRPPTYLVAFGSYPMALFRGRGAPLQYLVVSEGNAIGEAGLIDDELGVIFCYIGATSVSADFFLVRREEDGWRKVWSSDSGPWRDVWIPADSYVSFGAQDLSLLRVEWSSWGVWLEEDPFFESHACDHRFFDVLWERHGDEYLPQVNLPLDAPYYDRLWEITRPSAYASLFEFLRRLRAGDEAGASQLTSDPSVVEKAKALGLDDRAVTYEVASGPWPEDAFLFSTEDLTREFVATFVHPTEGEHWLLTDIGERWQLLLGDGRWGPSN